MNELAKQIEQFNNELATEVPQEVLEAFGKSIEDLQIKKIEEKSIKLGEIMPEFLLPNVKNEIINSNEILKNGKMIIALNDNVGANPTYITFEVAISALNLGITKDNAIMAKSTIEICSVPVTIKAT